MEGKMALLLHHLPRRIDHILATKESRQALSGPHLQDVINSALCILNHERGQVLGDQGLAPVRVHLVALRVQHLVVLPQLLPDVCTCTRTPPSHAPITQRNSNPKCYTAA